MSGRSGMAVEDDRGARAPRAAEGGHAAHHLARAGRRRRGPPQEPRRLLPSIRYGMRRRLDLDQLAGRSPRAPPRVFSEDLVELAGVEEDALAERAAVDVDALELLFLHVVAALRALHEVQLAAGACAPPPPSGPPAPSRASRGRSRAASSSCFSFSRNHSSSRLRSCPPRGPPLPEEVSRHGLYPGVPRLSTIRVNMLSASERSASDGSGPPGGSMADAFPISGTHRPQGVPVPARRPPPPRGDRLPEGRTARRTRRRSTSGRAASSSGRRTTRATSSARSSSRAARSRPSSSRTSTARSGRAARWPRSCPTPAS